MHMNTLTWYTRVKCEVKMENVGLFWSIPFGQVPFASDYVKHEIHFIMEYGFIPKRRHCLLNQICNQYKSFAKLN